MRIRESIRKVKGQSGNKGRQDIMGSNESSVYRIVNTNKTQYFLQVTKE